MRICSPQLGVAPDATLGGEVYDRETLKQMAHLGAEIEILLPAGRPCEQVAGWRVTRLPLRRGYRWFVSNWLFVPFIGRAYRRRAFDLLRVHSLRFTGMAALWARKLYRLPVPVVAHHHHVDRDRRTDTVDRRVARAVDLVITGSQFSRQQLVAEMGVAGEKVAVTRYGVAEMYHPAEETGDGSEADGNRPMILHVGSLKSRKNLPLLLEAFKRTVAQVPTAQLRLVGRGPEEEALRRRVRELGLEQSVSFAGFIGEREKLATYRQADLLVSASVMEGFGLAPAEAMACGVPVVAAAAGALPELLGGGEAGLLVPVNDPEALSTAMVRALTDRELAAKLAQAGRERVERLYRWSKTAADTLALYEGLL